jgi:hypothetical protein
VTYTRYVVFDDAPQHRGVASTADQFADALRSPLAAIGVRVVRQHSAGANSPRAGFQAHGWSRSQYNTKLNIVGLVVNDVTKILELARVELTLCKGELPKRSRRPAAWLTQAGKPRETRAEIDSTGSGLDVQIVMQNDIQQ